MYFLVSGTLVYTRDDDESLGEGAVLGLPCEAPIHQHHSAMAG